MKFMKFIFCLFLLFVSFYFTISFSSSSFSLSSLTDISSWGIFKNIFKSTMNSNTDNMFLLLGNSSNDVVLNTLDYKNDDKEMLVYLYNTHNREEYATTVYGITPTVVDVSSMIQNELLKYYVYSYVEDMDVVGEMYKKKLSYYDTYDISRSNIMKIRKKYPSIDYIFDVHRDSVTKDLSIVKIGDKSYAKVMFLIGKKNPNYKENEKNIEKMASYINKKYHGVLRSNYYNKYYFNQDISSNAFLVEVGGPDNTIYELHNTASVLAEAIVYLIKGEL